MEINLNDLSYKNKILIDDIISFPKEYLKNSDIQKLDNICIKGFLYQNEVNEYIANINVSGQMNLLDSITLKEIPYYFAFTIDDIIPENCINEQNMLDIMELLWQNIVLEEPIRYTKSDADNLKGDNWQVLSDNNKEEKIDPRMQKLYDYYNKGGE